MTLAFFQTEMKSSKEYQIEKISTLSSRMIWVVLTDGVKFSNEEYYRMSSIENSHVPFRTPKPVGE